MIVLLKLALYRTHIRSVCHLIGAKNGKIYYYDYKSLVLHPRVHERIKKAAEKRGITMSKLLYDTFSDE